MKCSNCGSKMVKWKWEYTKKVKICSVIIMAFFMTVVCGFSNHIESIAATERRGTTTGNFSFGGWAVEADGKIYYCFEGDLCKTVAGDDKNQILVKDINAALPDPYWGYLNVADDWLYFKTLHGSIYRVPLSGGEPQLFLAGMDKPWIGVNEFVIVDDWLYYNYEVKPNDGDSTRASKICRIRLDGSDNQELAYTRQIYWLEHVTNGYIYYQGIGPDDEWFHNYRLPVTGGQAECLDDIKTFREWLVDGAWVYYIADGDGQRLQRQRLDGSENEIIYDQGYCGGLNISGDWIYCFVRDTDKSEKMNYVRIRLDGTKLQILSETEGGGSVAGDIVCSQLGEVWRIRESENGPYLELVAASRYTFSN